MLTFSGNQRAHGIFSIAEQNANGKRVGAYKIIKTPPTEELWSKHLKGEEGLGIIPIRDDNCCCWGAIDIDTYSVDHKSLVQKLKKENIPGFVARSKKNPEDVLYDPQIWQDMWQNARDELAKEEQFAFNRWDGEDPACA